MNVELKEEIRKKLLGLLRKQKKEERIHKSREILSRLFVIPEFQKASNVLFYAAFDGEVETLEMMQQAQKLGKKIALPIILKDRKNLIPYLVENLNDELEPGPYGIYQPDRTYCKKLAIPDVDLVIVPGVAFDKQNYRLGRGAGYYDRFLKQVSPHTSSFGLAFDFQILDRLPHAQHDIPVSQVVSNS